MATERRSRHKLQTVPRVSDSMYNFAPQPTTDNQNRGTAPYSLVLGNPSRRDAPFPFGENQPGKQTPALSLYKAFLTPWLPLVPQVNNNNNDRNNNSNKTRSILVQHSRYTTPPQCPAQASHDRKIQFNLHKNVVVEFEKAAPGERHALWYSPSEEEAAALRAFGSVPFRRVLLLLGCVLLVVASRRRQQLQQLPRVVCGGGNGTRRIIESNNNSRVVTE